MLPAACGSAPCRRTCGNATLPFGTMLTTARALSSRPLVRTKLTNSASVAGSANAAAPATLASGRGVAGVFVPSPA